MKQAAIRPLTLTSFIVAPATYSAGTTYPNGAFVIDSANQMWISLVAGNIGNTPGASTAWDYYFGPLTADINTATTSYFAGEITYITTTPYLSLTTGNTDTPPTANWITMTGATLVPIVLPYPIGSGPTSSTTTHNIFRLPANFLRQAPLDSRAGSTSYLGAPSALPYNDWQLQGDYLISMESQPIVFRFVADVYNVPEMDDMFCEGLAARLAENTCEAITQSTGKMQALTRAYNVTIGEARAVNGIEMGATEPPEDDWITCRQ